MSYLGLATAANVYGKLSRERRKKDEALQLKALERRQKLADTEDYRGWVEGRESARVTRDESKDAEKALKLAEENKQKKLDDVYNANYERLASLSKTAVDKGIPDAIQEIEALKKLNTQYYKEGKELNLDDLSDIPVQVPMRPVQPLSETEMSMARLMENKRLESERIAGVKETEANKKAAREAEKASINKVKAQRKDKEYERKEREKAPVLYKGRLYSRKMINEKIKYQTKEVSKIKNMPPSERENYKKGEWEAALAGANSILNEMEDAATAYLKVEETESKIEPAPRDPAKRKVGNVYSTPKGNMKWMGNGWQPVQ